MTIDHSEGLDIAIRPERVARVLLLLVLALATLGCGANLIIYQVAPSPEHKLARLMERFDLGHEPSIPALYSSLSLAVSAGLLAVIAITHRRCRSRFVSYWTVLSLIFLALAIDESVMIHEMVDNVLHDWLQTSGIFHFAWVIPAMLFVFILSLCYLRFFWSLNRRTLRLFIYAGTVFVGGAVGMEMVAALIIPNLGVESIAHTISQTIEETCEMLGVVIFIYALLDYIRREIGPLRIRCLVERRLAAPTRVPDINDVSASARIATHHANQSNG